MVEFLFLAWFSAMRRLISICSLGGFPEGFVFPEGHKGRQDLTPGWPDSPTGQRSLHHRGDSLETLVLLNPSDKSLCDEVGNG